MTISAKLIADSVNPSNHRISTWEIEAPRFFWSEVLTHRELSRNAASSRAIPVKKMLLQVFTNMAFPIHWGRKQTGMQANKEINPLFKLFAKGLWAFAGYSVAIFVSILLLLGLHKQVANRLLEPWTHIKAVITTTKYSNFFKLRLHKDAQPEFYELARQMQESLDNSTPTQLKWGEWHLPYVTEEDRSKYKLEDLIKISSSSSAQVSYRKLDTSLDTATRIFDRLVTAEVIHASPFEHPAQATKSKSSGNFTGTNWTQYRHYVEKNKSLE
jgi:hypothetical protein